MVIASPIEITFKASRVFAENLLAWLGDATHPPKRRALNEGGISSTKTFSILQLLYSIASQAKGSLLISVVSESLPHLKRGCIRDFFRILGESQDNNPRWNKTECIYHMGNATIEFFGADDAGKARGPRRDILFINEGNNVVWEVARGLDTRTSTFTFVDWNPVGEFWAHEFWLNQPQNAYIHSTYEDAREFLSAQQVADYESYRERDPNWWNVYGLGLLGKVEGLVHPHFSLVDVLPPGDKFYGLDFGFSLDPNALAANVIVGDSLYSQELLYEAGLTNDVIARRMDLLGVRQRYDEIFADSAEPKSIQEIYERGFNIKPCEKGAGSVEYGIQKVNQLKQYWTKDSVNCIKEQRNFRYIPDKDGKFTDKTTHMWSHGMTARRYAVSSRIVHVGSTCRIKTNQSIRG